MCGCHPAQAQAQHFRIFICPVCSLCRTRLPHSPPCKCVVLFCFWHTWQHFCCFPSFLPLPWIRGAEISQSSTTAHLPQALHRPDPAADPALSLCYCWAAKSSGRQPSSVASGGPSSAPWVGAHTRSACECMGVYVYANSTLGPYIRTSPQRTPILRAFLTYLCRFMFLLILHKIQKGKKVSGGATTNKSVTLSPRPLARVVVGSLPACS